MRKMLSDYDVIIIGSGIAGLYTALKIDSSKKIAVLTKDVAENSNTNLAQGGVAVTFNPDEYESHVMDTMRTGNYYNNEDRLKMMVSEGSDNINTLIDWGVNFDTDDNGELLLTKEGGHSSRRIIHYKDTTGQEIVSGLLKTVSTKSNIDLLEQIFVKDIIIKADQAVGVEIIDNETLMALYSPQIVIAAGGIGELYANTTNATVCTGDGIAMAKRAGAEIIDMEFVQFHPTALNVPGHSHFLISEAVRGEGGILRNMDGLPFMEKYHELKDLAPRSVVSKAIFEESSRQGNDKIFLDVTHLGDDFIKNRFPNIYHECYRRGIDIVKDLIPIVPVQHYIMGGIETDENGLTSVEGLYACGEVACTGVHGANRMASNSLLEGVVFANRVAQMINKVGHVTSNGVTNRTKIDHILNHHGMIQKAKKDLQIIMSDKVFIFRNEDALKEAKSEIESLEESVDLRHIDQSTLEFRNMLIVSKLIIEAALSRKDSLGSHIIEGEN
jgi:L-aspartate oxidase